jgi:GrpB-like predicted nucleotidyltransferase (UPF0157 family)
MKPHRPFELQEYDPEWKKHFLDSAAKLKPLFGDNLMRIEHMGSTSIEGMMAKPQVDILVVVKNLDEVKGHYEQFTKAGFTPRGRGYVTADDEYFTEDAADGRRLTSVHTLQFGNPKIQDYLTFRDYLRGNSGDRNLYIETKRKLYSLHHDDYAAYDNGKKEVIAAITDHARGWSAGQKHPLKLIVKNHLAWVPIVLSLAMIVYIYSLLALNGIPQPDPNADEGVAAHLFQLWLVVEFLMIVFFAFKWLPRTPKSALIILAIQIFLVLVGCFPIFYFKL